MPNGTTIGHVHLHVGDLDQAAAFYHEALGFDKVVWSYPGALFLSAGGYHHHLGTNTWAAGAPPPTEDDARLLEWEMVLPDAASVAAAAASVETAGGTDRAVGGWKHPGARSVGNASSDCGRLSPRRISSCTAPIGAPWSLIGRGSRSDGSTADRAPDGHEARRRPPCAISTARRSANDDDIRPC